MNKNEFFNILMDNLKGIPEKKLQDIILHYDNLFDSEINNGKSEQEIVTSLGSIDVLIRRYKDESSQTENIKNISESSSDIDIYNNYDLNSNETSMISNEIYYNHNTEDNIHHYTNIDENTNNPKPNNTANVKKGININLILKICILILSIIIFTPILTTVISVIIGIFGTAIGIFFGSIGLLIGGTFTSFAGIPNIPNFISNFPYPVLVLFCLGSVALSIMLFIMFCYFIKALIIGIKKLYSLLMY